MGTRPAIFKWRQTEPGLILCAVRWYLRYSLSLRDVEELLEERGLNVDHTRSEPDPRSSNGGRPNPASYFVRSGGIFAILFRCAMLRNCWRSVASTSTTPDRNPTRDLQMAADRTRPHTLCGPVVSSLFSFAARC